MMLIIINFHGLSTLGGFRMVKQARQRRVSRGFPRFGSVVFLAEASP